jgi:hypothetical protein
MKLKYMLVAGLLLILTSSLSATSGRSSNKTISVCRIEYTSLGKSANWHFNYTYLVEANSDGSVIRLSKLETAKRPAFVNEDAIIDCIKTWNLLPSGQHVVHFSIGTSGGNSISIVDPARNVVKLVLP